MKTFLHAAVASIFFAGALAQAAQVTGTVTNKTTGKPASGDAVALVEPMAGMAEVAHTKVDASGHYSLDPVQQRSGAREGHAPGRGLLCRCAAGRRRA